MSPLATWKELREDIDAAHVRAEAAYAAVGDNLMHAGRRKDALYDLTEALRTARDDLGRLSQLLAESSEPETPARPLEAVLADIVALGHENVSVIRRASPLRWYVQSDNASERWPGSDSGSERIRAHYAAVEQGEAESPGGDMEAAAQAAEARLAQIRELREQRTVEPTEADVEAFLTAIGAGPEEVDSEHEAHLYDATHILAGTGVIRIADGQHQRYAVGELSREGDSLPWKVVERREGQAPCVIDGYVTREAAEAVRDELNGAAALWAASVEHEPITGPTDAEEDDRATAEHCPQRPGGHEFDSYHVCVHCEYERDAEAAELAALARADHERVRMASEGEEA